MIDHEQGTGVDEAAILREVEKKKQIEQADREARAQVRKAENAEALKFLKHAPLESARKGRELVNATIKSFLDLPKPPQPTQPKSK